MAILSAKFMQVSGLDSYCLDKKGFHDIVYYTAYSSLAADTGTLRIMLKVS